MQVDAMHLGGGEGYLLPINTERRVSSCIDTVQPLPGLTAEALGASGRTIPQKRVPCALPRV